MKRKSKVKDPTPFCATISAKRYLEWHRGLINASEVFKRLTDLLLKLVDAHKARDALKEVEPTEKYGVKFLIGEGLRHLALAEHFFYRAYENEDVIREDELRIRKSQHDLPEHGSSD